SNPCSEYMFLDNTACNLASLNVLKFYDRDARSFDVDRYEHGVDIWTTVLEISVLMAAFPSQNIAELSWKYRTLGLGYANLGAMLMQAGIPYDSDEGRAVCSCLSAIMTGRSYRQSALLASEHGAFAGYDDDRENMLRVIRNHRLAARGEPRDSERYEKLRIAPVPIDHELVESGKIGVNNAMELLRRACTAWDDAYTLGTKHGYRNAQTTVIAPTGTIGLLMDCDTTGVEPDFALVKFKKLAGGGYFKIANASVRPALEALGYRADQIREMMSYLLGTLDLEVPMPVDNETAKLGVQEGMTLAQWLRTKGATDGDLSSIKEQLPGVFELGFAFGGWALGDETLTRLGFDAEKAKSDMGFNALKAFGLSASHLESLNRTICGTQTVEGAPHLKDEHLPVFDCANTCGPLSTRFIAPAGHIKMMAAAQPFITGAISKTINLPHDAGVGDIKDCYRLSWELGLKANALYRDGCKLSQPLNSTASAEVDVDEEVSDDPLEEAEALNEVAGRTAEIAVAAAAGDVETVEREVVRVVHRPMRQRLPETRRSFTHKFNVAGHEGYLTVGLYDSGAPGELFITMAKEGSTIGGLMDSLGTATSVALQYGVPLESLVRKFTHQRFEPAGITANKEIPIAKSLVDYIFRWLGIQFIDGYREKVVPSRAGGPTDQPVAPDGNGTRQNIDGADRFAGASNGNGGHRWDRDKAKGTTDGTRRRGAPSRMEISDSLDDSIDEDLPVVPLDVMPAGGDAAVRSGASVARSGSHPSGQTGGSVVIESKRSETETVTVVQTSTLSDALDAMGDAPPCDVCGSITVRSGTCHKCMNCGNSMGCS
ncbi:MAG: vitamin B12-dependent ribonucleotide reductase, partial [Planctomycetota bacterium]